MQDWFSGRLKQLVLDLGRNRIPVEPAGSSMATDGAALSTSASQETNLAIANDLELVA